MSKKDEIQETNGLAAVSKDLVKKTRKLATKTRDEMWSSWTGMTKENRATSMMVWPWYEVAREAYDMWLEAYETQACYAIDKTAQAMEQAQNFQGWRR